MTPIHHHAHKVVHHVRTHHKKYLVLGSVMAGVFAIMKVMVLFATSFALFSSSHDVSFADDNPLNEPLAQSEVRVDAEQSDYSTLIDTGDTQLSTGSDTIDTGTLLDLIAYSVAQTLTGSIDTGDVSSGTVSSTTGSITTGVVTTGTTVQEVSTFQSDTGVQYYEDLLKNQVVYCHSGDIVLGSDLSGQTFSDIASFQWLYSGNCTMTADLSFQLYDHNNQWIEISTVSPSNFGFSFDTNFLYTGGWYALTGLNTSGAVYTIDPGLYSGVASNFWTGYKIRILNTDTQESLYESSTFSIDNVSPKLSGFKFVYYTGADRDGEVHLLFNASEELGDISISLSSGKASSKSASGTQYDVYLRGYGTGFSGAIGFIINFEDLRGNTGSVSGTGYLSFSGSTFSLAETGISLLAQLRQQLDNFNTCKDSLTYKTISLNVGGNHLKLNMPNFRKSEVKKLISAFSSSVIDKLDSVNGIDQSELDSLTKTYDNFLVVLKLVEDDENTCEQNLSNYYMGLFTTTLENYGIDL